MKYGDFVEYKGYPCMVSRQIANLIYLYVPTEYYKDNPHLDFQTRSERIALYEDCHFITKEVADIMRRSR